MAKTEHHLTNISSGGRMKIPKLILRFLLLQIFLQLNYSRKFAILVPFANFIRSGTIRFLFLLGLRTNSLNFVFFAELKCESGISNFRNSNLNLVLQKVYCLLKLDENYLNLA